jgi:hypothetical protein
MESKILKNFFEKEHQKWRKRAYTIYEYTLGDSHRARPTQQSHHPDHSKSAVASNQPGNKPDRG